MGMKIDIGYFVDLPIGELRREVARLIIVNTRGQINVAGIRNNLKGLTRGDLIGMIMDDSMFPKGVGAIRR